VWARLSELFAREDGGTEERRRLWHHQMGVYGLRLNDVLGGDAATVRRWAGCLNERPLETDVVTPRAQLARARHAAAERRWGDAAVYFGWLLPHAARMDVMGQTIEIQARAAHALLHCDRLPDAAQALAPALDRMRIEGERGHALMCGPAVLSTLAQAPWGTLLSSEQLAELRAAAELAAALRGEAAPVERAVAAPSTGAAGARAAELLSAREREVLERIAAGDSNKIIARVLDISPHTVKRHVANILDKLGLGSRGQASAWLRASA